MNVRRFIDLPFVYVGGIEPEGDGAGQFAEFMPQSRYRDAATVKLHAYGAGPFCRFRIGRAHHEAGLYVVTLDEAPVYAGECVDLGKRFSPNGYGGISPRNCFDRGQPTNCRVNAAILVAAMEERRIDLWFCPFDGDSAKRRTAETTLIQSLAPPWNRAKNSAFAP